MKVVFRKDSTIFGSKESFRFVIESLSILSLSHIREFIDTMSLNIVFFVDGGNLSKGLFELCRSELEFSFSSI